MVVNNSRRSRGHREVSSADCTLAIGGYIPLEFDDPGLSRGSIITDQIDESPVPISACHNPQCDYLSPYLRVP